MFIGVCVFACVCVRVFVCVCVQKLSHIDSDHAASPRSIVFCVHMCACACVCACVHVCVCVCMCGNCPDILNMYGVATISRLLKIIVLVCRI